MKKSEIIVDKLLLDLTSRKGFEEEWYTIDEKIRNKIKQEWIRIVNQELEQVKSTQAAEGLKLGDMNIEFGKKEEEFNRSFFYNDNGKWVNIEDDYNIQDFSQDKPVDEIYEIGNLNSRKGK